MLDTISTISKDNFKGLLQKNENLCTLELTVPTGLEEVAAQEIREKLNVEPTTFRGRVLIDLEINKVNEALKLRSVDHIYILVHMEQNFNFEEDRYLCFQKLYKYSKCPDWRKGIKAWQTVFGLDVGDPFGNENNLLEECAIPRPDLDLRLMKKDSPLATNIPESILNSIPKNKIEDKPVEKEMSIEVENKPSEEITLKIGPKFRVSCHRVGSKHKFGSPEAARQFGAGINEKFGWPVDLKNYELEVNLNIDEDFVYTCIALTKEALFRRNITNFGPTNLRATICYSMIHLAKPQFGEIIVDPMCGGATIPMEGALTFKNCFYLGSDNASGAVIRSKKNIDSLMEKEKKSLNIDLGQFDCNFLPLRNEVADIIISDLPFGKRMGSKIDNRVLYLRSLVEMARITKLKTGRAVLLTHDKNSMAKSMLRVSKLWKLFSNRTINIGGLAAGVYLLHRTSSVCDQAIIEDLKLPKIENRSKKRKWHNVSTENTSE